MAVSIERSFRLVATESTANDLGTAIQPHQALPPNVIFESGTTDSKFDLVFSDTRTLTATSETLDFAGSLTAVIGGGTITMVEIGVIYIRNKATAAASILTLGNATNPAFTNLLGGSTQTVKIPAGGIFYWEAPLDGGGLTVAAGTADGLKLDSGAATITYDILVAGRSA